MAVPYDGQPYSAPAFQIEKEFWNHTTCDHCGTRIAAMNLCYVTERGLYDALCITCYKNHVVSKLGFIRALFWRMKRVVGVHAGA